MCYFNACLTWARLVILAWRFLVVGVCGRWRRFQYFVFVLVMMYTALHYNYNSFKNFYYNIITDSLTLNFFLTYTPLRKLSSIIPFFQNPWQVIFSKIFISQISNIVHDPRFKWRQAVLCRYQFMLQNILAHFPPYLVKTRELKNRYDSPEIPRRTYLVLDCSYEENEYSVLLLSI